MLHENDRAKTKVKWIKKKKQTKTNRKTQKQPTRKIQTKYVLCKELIWIKNKCLSGDKN